jgi:hypothetical protein
LQIEYSFDEAPNDDVPVEFNLRILSTPLGRRNGIRRSLIEAAKFVIDFPYKRWLPRQFTYYDHMQLSVKTPRQDDCRSKRHI